GIGQEALTGLVRFFAHPTLLVLALEAVLVAERDEALVEVLELVFVAVEALLGALLDALRLVDLGHHDALAALEGLADRPTAEAHQDEEEDSRVDDARGERQRLVERIAVIGVVLVAPGVRREAPTPPRLVAEADGLHPH